MKRLTLLSLVLVMTLGLAACSDFTKTSYRTLATTSLTYDTFMTAAGDAYRAGAVTEDQKETLTQYGTAVEGALNIARKALESYFLAGESDGDLKQKVVSALADLAMQLSTLQVEGGKILGAFAPQKEV